MTGKTLTNGICRSKRTIWQCSVLKCAGDQRIRSPYAVLMLSPLQRIRPLSCCIDITPLRAPFQSNSQYITSFSQLDGRGWIKCSFFPMAIRALPHYAKLLGTVKLLLGGDTWRLVLFSTRKRPPRPAQRRMHHADPSQVPPPFPPVRSSSHDRHPSTAEQTTHQALE